jgi:ATP diphosphatase
VVDKVAEEARELSRAVKDSDKDAMEDELGDLLFSLVNLARHLKLDPEKALRRANGKFSRRFRHAEEAARQEGKELGQLSPGELDALWSAAKAGE